MQSRLANHRGRNMAAPWRNGPSARTGHLSRNPKALPPPKWNKRQEVQAYHECGKQINNVLWLLQRRHSHFPQGHTVTTNSDHSHLGSLKSFARSSGESKGVSYTHCNMHEQECPYIHLEFLKKMRTPEAAFLVTGIQHSGQASQGPCQEPGKP